MRLHFPCPAVIFSHVKSSGNSRRRSGFFPTERNLNSDPHSDEGTFQRHSETQFLKSRESEIENIEEILSGAVAPCRIYGGLTNCTFQVALRVDCFWPNQIVDRFFMQVHRLYFQDCALTGRLLHEPPVSILAPFIAVPVLVTLLMTALVVWRSKRSEGVL